MEDWFIAMLIFALLLLDTQHMDRDIDIALLC